MSHKLLQNDWLRSMDRLQDFFRQFLELHKIHSKYTRRHMEPFQKILFFSWKHFRNLLFVHILTFWNSKILILLTLPYTNIFWIVRVLFWGFPPNETLHLRAFTMYFSKMRFGMCWKAHYFDKMKTINKSEWIKNSSKKYGSFINDAGMLWNLDILGKSNLIIYLIRVDYW